MAETIVKKDAGGGWFEVVLGCNDADSASVSQRSTIAIVRFNKHAYDALGANGQQSIQNQIGGGIINGAFD